jgi:hypothetical protein
MAAPLRDDSSTPRDQERILDHFRTFVTHVSSDRAQQILDKLNWRRQRDISHGWVADLRMAILKNELTFLTLVYAEFPDGTQVLVDGQHRLTALATLQIRMEAQVTVHRVADERELGVLYLKYDRAKTRGPEVALKARGILDRVEHPDKLKKLAPGVQIVRSGFSPSYRADKSMISRSDGVEDWLSECETYIRLISAAPRSDQRALSRAPVVAVALATIRHQPDISQEFWTRAASQEMLASDDPRLRLMAFLRENKRVTGYRGVIREIHYSRYVAAAWNAFYEGRPLKLLKASDISGPVRILGTPYGSVTTL